MNTELTHGKMALFGYGVGLGQNPQFYIINPSHIKVAKIFTSINVNTDFVLFDLNIFEQKTPNFRQRNLNVISHP